MGCKSSAGDRLEQMQNISVEASGWAIIIMWLSVYGRDDRRRRNDKESARSTGQGAMRRTFSLIALPPGPIKRSHNQMRHIDA